MKCPWFELLIRNYLSFYPILVKELPLTEAWLLRLEKIVNIRYSLLSFPLLPQPVHLNFLTLWMHPRKSCEAPHTSKLSSSAILAKTVWHIHPICPMCFDPVMDNQIFKELKRKLLQMVPIKWIIKTVDLVILVSTKATIKPNEMLFESD